MTDKKRMFRHTEEPDEEVIKEKMRKLNLIFMIGVVILIILLILISATIH